MIPFTLYPKSFTSADLDHMVSTITSCSETVDFHDTEGVWKDKGTVANIIHWDWNDPRAADIKHKLTTLLEPVLGTFAVDRSHILDAQLPWDIHNDTVIRCEVKDTDPQAVVMIPLQDCDARTIVFNQSADYDLFRRYRAENPPISDHVPVDQWNKWLNHCWPKDRYWLSINSVYEWRQGDVVIFSRRAWHASDNFKQTGLENKRAIILFTGTKKDATIKHDQETPAQMVS
jgi:hypothetical protein